MPMRIAAVNRRRCVSCGTCEKVCPKGAVWVYRGCYAVVDGQRCIGCGRCAKQCPAECIQMEAREEHEKKAVV